MTICYLSLGSNLATPKAKLIQACTLINRLPKTSILKKSTVHKTKPWGNIKQPDFYNQVICITTHLSPEKLLYFCQDIENKLGRVRKIKWGPRTIDIDILTFGELKLAKNKLTIPHPYMRDRDFVMIPLKELHGTSGPF